MKSKKEIRISFEQNEDEGILSHTNLERTYNIDRPKAVGGGGEGRQGGELMLHGLVGIYMHALVDECERNGMNITDVHIDAVGTIGDLVISTGSNVSTLTSLEMTVTTNQYGRVRMQEMIKKSIPKCVLFNRLTVAPEIKLK